MLAGGRIAKGRPGKYAMTATADRPGRPPVPVVPVVPWEGIMAFADRVAVITGTSSGIGWELTRQLAARNCKVGMVARRQDQLEKLADVIRRAGGTAAYAVADVAERDQTFTAIRQLVDQLGPVDLLIANAGVGAPTLIDPMNVEHIEQMIRVNLLGVVYSIEAVLPDMLKRRSGHLAAVSSLAAYRSLPGESGYCASKAGVNAFLDGLRIQLRKRGIAVTTICPGFVWTPMTQINKFKMPFLLQADVAAGRIIRALERRRKVYNFPWQTTFLMRLLGWLPDWAVARVMSDYNAKPPMPAQL
jgi:short-subunit dehydrogenase